MAERHPLAALAALAALPVLPAQDAPTALAVPARAGALAPRLTAGAGGIALSWLEPDGESGHRLRFARFGPAANAFGPARTVTRGTDVFVNWADTPSVVLGPRGALAHWLRRRGARHAYDVVLAGSADGERWTVLGSPHRDDTDTEHGFVSILAGASGFDVFWLDGRDFARADPGRMALRHARVEDAIGPEIVLDADVCTCCPTGAARGDRPLVVYRDRTEREIRDIGIVALGEGGTWSTPRTVHDDGWLMPGCPVNGAAVAADGAGVAVAYFTVRDGAEVRLALSADGGETFAPPITVDGDRPIGRCAVALADGVAVVCWLAAGDEGGEDALVRLCAFAADGAAGEPLDVAATGSGRQAGFPQLAPTGDAVVVAWRDGTGERARIAAARVPLAALR